MNRTRTSGPRCVECRKPVDLSDRALVRKELPAGLNMNRLHRMEMNYWHAACWQTVTEWVEESRRKSEELTRETVRQIAAAAGLPDPYAE